MLALTRRCPARCAQPDDVSGAITFAAESGQPGIAYVAAGNPKVGWPYVSFDGSVERLSEGESKDVSSQGHSFRAARGADTGDAKDLYVYVLA